MVHSFVRSVNYETGSMKDEIVLSRAEGLGGGGYPHVAQQRNEPPGHRLAAVGAMDRPQLGDGSPQFTGHSEPPRNWPRQIVIASEARQSRANVALDHRDCFGASGASQ